MNLFSREDFEPVSHVNRVDTGVQMGLKKGIGLQKLCNFDRNEINHKEISFPL